MTQLLHFCKHQLHQIPKLNAHVQRFELMIHGAANTISQFVTASFLTFQTNDLFLMQHFTFPPLKQSSHILSGYRGGVCFHCSTSVPAMLLSGEMRCWSFFRVLTHLTLSLVLFLCNQQPHLLTHLQSSFTVYCAASFSSILSVSFCVVAL